MGKKNKKHRQEDEMHIPSIRKLHEERDEKAKSKNGIFKVILNKCVEKIVYTNRYTEKTFIIFEVPKVLIGNPGYDMNSCISYMISQLSNSGYIVEFIEPFYLYIDWGSTTKYNTTDHSTHRSHNYKTDTRAIMEKFPNASKIEFVYEDAISRRGKRGNKK